jgi:hypothetical protein
MYKLNASDYNSFLSAHFTRESFFRCRNFGSGDFIKLYNDFKEDTSVTWNLNPAVRHTTGACVEENNCDWEKVTLCAFNQTDTAGKVQYLGCMDEREGTYKSASRECAKKTDLDEEKILACYNSDLGTELLEEASKVFNGQFPERATVPHTFVNQKDTPPEFSDLKSALCKAGSAAKVCANFGVANSTCVV